MADALQRRQTSVLRCEGVRRLPEGFLHLRPLGDVLVDHDDFFILQASPYPRSAHHTGNVSAIFVPAGELLAVGQLLLQFGIEAFPDLLVLLLRTVELPGGLAEQFLGFPAKDGLHAGVGKDDAAFL